MLAALFTGMIAVLVLPFFSYIPMTVIAAILVNTALGLLEIRIFEELWRHERESFVVAILVIFVTVFHDAGMAVGIGATLTLFLFARKVAHGRFDATWNFTDGTKKETRGNRHLVMPSEKSVSFVTYSIAGTIGYIDASRHYVNLKAIANSGQSKAVIIRLRNLFSIDLEGIEALKDAIYELERKQVAVYVSSVSEQIANELLLFDAFAKLNKKGHFTIKTSDAIDIINKG